MNVLVKGIRKIFIDLFGENLIFKNNEDEIVEKILVL